MRILKIEEMGLVSGGLQTTLVGIINAGGNGAAGGTASAVWAALAARAASAHMGGVGGAGQTGGISNGFIFYIS